MKRKYYPTLWAWLALFTLGVIAAMAGVATAHAEPLRLDAKAPFVDAAGHLERLNDPSGALTASQAGQAPGWTPLPGSLSAGFTSDTVWMRLPLQVDDVPRGGWMLRLSNSLLDDVSIYLADTDAGPWTLLGRSGEDVPRRNWPVDYRSPVIQFDPPAPGAYVILARLQSKNAVATRFEVWQRLAFDNQSRREACCSACTSASTCC